jgi:hypothetical protein
VPLACAIAFGGTFSACSSTSAGPTAAGIDGGNDAAAPADDGGTSTAPSDDAAGDMPSTQPAPDASAADTSAPDDGGIEDAAADAAACRVAPLETCPTTVPSFASDVLPILDAKCNGCHTGALGEPWALTNHADVEAWALSINIDLTRCTMPPADAGTGDLTKTELNAVLGWIVCGAPNN